MYNDIARIYHEIFTLNHAFLSFIPAYLKSTGSRVLDLGCGPGDYVNELLRAGHEAAGIDSSAGMIDQAQAHNQGTFYNLSFTEINQLEGPFDCIFCIGNSLSYLPPDLTGPFLEDVYRLLSDGGYFLVQVVNWDKFRSTEAADFPVKTLSDGKTFHRNYASGPGGTVLFQTELREAGKVLGIWSDPLYPKYMVDLSADVRGSGMKVVDIFGDFNRSPFTSSSPATILVAQK